MTSYFMNTYNVVIDDSMIRNMMQTDMKESMDLLSVKQVLYFIFFGLLPAYVVYKSRIHYRKLKPELLSKLKQLLALALIMTVIIFVFFTFI